MSTPPSAQPSPPKPRKKRSADVVSFEDLLAAHKTERGPGQLPAEGVVLIGVDLELQRRMAEGIGLPPPLDHSFQGAPKFGAPDTGAPNPPAKPLTGLQSDASLKDSDSRAAAAANAGAPKEGAPKFGAPHFDAPEFNLRQLLVRRSGTKSYVVHPVSRIEDVFTSAERELLRWLWEKGRPVPTTPRIRLVTGPNGEGARRLAVQAGLIYNTFKNLTRTLSAKFAVDIVKPERNLPTVYAIYHYSSILERQRLAGFTGAVHKNGGGRDLVNAKAEPAPRRPDSTMEELELILGAPKFSAPNQYSSAPNFAAVSGNFGAPKIAALIRNKEYTSEKENTSSPSGAANIGAPKFVVDALFQRTGRTDVEAARLIAKGCLDANPTIQPEEIARLIRTAPIPSNITNPVGLLIRALPSRCVPESIGNYREQWRREDDQEKRRQQQDHAQTLETARNILDSLAKGEQWDTETIEWARSTLDNAGPGSDIR